MSGSPSFNGIDNDEYLIPVALSLQDEHQGADRPAVDASTVFSPDINSTSSGKPSIIDPKTVRLPHSRLSTPVNESSHNTTSGGTKSSHTDRLSQGATNSFPEDYRQSTNTGPGAFVCATDALNSLSISAAPLTIKSVSSSSSNLVSSKSMVPSNEHARYQSLTKLYGVGNGVAAKAQHSLLFLSSSENPCVKYHLCPNTSSLEFCPQSNIHDFSDDDTIGDVSQLALEDGTKAQLIKSWVDVGTHRFTANTSSGYNSDLGSGEPSPPPDYRTVFESIAETV